MEQGQFLNLKAIGEKLKKFKYPLFILLLGAGLLLWPAKKAPVVEETEALHTVTPAVQEDSTQMQMERILSCIDGGAGSAHQKNGR